MAALGLARLLPRAAGAVSLAGGLTCAARASECEDGASWFWKQAAPPPPPQPSQAVLLRQVAERAHMVLHEPPSAFARCRSAWRKYLDKESALDLERSQFGLRDAVLAASKQRAAVGEADLDDAVLGALASTLQGAERAMAAARQCAVRAAAAVPWGAALQGAKLERADGAPTAAAAAAADATALHGKVVALYFTASWCGPCHRFTPMLVELHAAARARGAPFEVLLVGWDEDPEARRAYARSHRMEWLACGSAELADELTLRYDVKGIPTMAVVEVSADGKQATLLSLDGRHELERYRAAGGSAGSAAGWIQKVLGA
jgi:thiol-disulfide isomerase/thioredoxin